jgi:hypothetical protein
MVVTVGFLLEDATLGLAKRNPGTEFAIADVSHGDPLDNLLGLTFAADEAAFLGGYLTAGMSETGKAGTSTVIEWGPTLVEYVRETNPGTPYNPDPQALLPLLIDSLQSTWQWSCRLRRDDTDGELPRSLTVHFHTYDCNVGGHTEASTARLRSFRVPRDEAAGAHREAITPLERAGQRDHRWPRARPSSSALLDSWAQYRAGG